MSARLFHGDAAMVLREQFAERSIDAIYSDPPFGNRQQWVGTAGAFSDRWSWSPEAAEGWALLRDRSPCFADILASRNTHESDRAYVGIMARLLIELRRVLKPTGTLWLHHDDVMGTDLRLLGDAVFDPPNALGVVYWRRTSSHNKTRGFGRTKDTIAVWGRTRVARWRLWRIGETEIVHSGDPLRHEVGVDGLLLDDHLTATSKERVGYPTQKPVSLLTRILRHATLPGDLVLDPTCGSGTTLVAASQLGRRGVGIDISADAIEAARARLRAPVQQELFAA